MKVKLMKGNIRRNREIEPKTRSAPDNLIDQLIYANRLNIEQGKKYVTEVIHHRCEAAIGAPHLGCVRRGHARPFN